MRNNPNTTDNREVPAVVWLDDSVDKWGQRFLDRKAEELGEVGIPIEGVLFKDTDDAVEFIINNAVRVFMLIQDTFRDEGTIIPGWKTLRPTDTPPVGFRNICGDFSVFVMDAFVPEATQLYHGAYYSEDERRFLEAWEDTDRRIVYSPKPSLMLTDEKDIWVAQWKRWRDAYSNKSVSEEGHLLKLVAEEMAVLCGTKPQYLERLTPGQFEELIASLFKNHGFTVHLTARTRDGGYDIVAVDHSKIPHETTLVEVKHFAPHRPVGVGVVRALYGVKMLHGASKGILATSSYVSRDAKREFTRVIPWELEFKEKGDIINWCESYASSLLSEKPEDDTAEPSAALDGDSATLHPRQ